MKLLIISMTESVHTARWIKQIKDTELEIHIFPSVDYGFVHEELRNVVIYHSFYGKQKNKHKTVRCKGVYLSSKKLSSFFRLILSKIFTEYRSWQLIRTIKKIKPDIIHTLETQHGGYLVLKAKKHFKHNFPSWIHTNWGSDIYLYGRLSEHENKIREVLSNCEYYSCECKRDVHLAKKYGFKGKTLPVFPNAGGVDLNLAQKLKKIGLVSERKGIMLKGYQHWAGRALVGLRALERCVDLLKEKEFMIYIYSVSKDVKIPVELFSKSTKIPIKIIPSFTKHSDILKLHGNSRISLGLSISDGISTSLLEAIIMGSFPIQSWTSCADEWIIDGETGILVPPEDPEIIEQAIRRALTDDELVDRAAEKNWEVAQERLEYNFLKQKTIDLYKFVFEELRKKHGK